MYTQHPHSYAAILDLVLVYFFLPPIKFLKQSQRERTHNTQPHHRPPRLRNLLIRDRLPHIPHQMPHPVQTVKGKRPRDQGLRHELDRQRQPAKRRCQRRALEVPAGEGRDQVGRAEDVQTAGEHRARDAVQDRGNPSDLALVDGEVGRDGAFEPLVFEDAVGGVGRDVLLGCGASVIGAIGSDWGVFTEEQVVR